MKSIGALQRYFGQWMPSKGPTSKSSTTLAEKRDDKNADWSRRDGKGYILNRAGSHIAAGRLNLQYYLWKESLQFSIHPSIVPQLPIPSPVIADVACGTGLWLIDVARELPSAEIHGLDFNLSQLPHPKWLPKNIKTRHWNVFEPPPDDLVGRFDMVHTRLLVLVVQHSDPMPIIRNLCKLLKPGGFIQWDDIDTVNLCIKRVEDDLATPALDELLHWSDAGGRHAWTVKLADFFAKGGLEEANTYFFEDSPEMMRAHSELHSLTAEEFANGLVKLGQTEAAEKYARLVDDANGELAQGAALMVPRVVCVARKPL